MSTGFLDVLTLAITIYAIMRATDHIEQFVNYWWKSYIGVQVEKDSGTIVVYIKDMDSGAPINLVFEDLKQYREFINNHTITFNKLKKDVKDEIEELKKLENNSD